MIASPRVRLPWARGLGHGLVILAGWAVFAWFWWLVIGRPWESLDLRRLVGWATLLFPLLTGAWIVHNLGIYRRRGARRAVPPGPMLYEVDFYGRQVDADWAALRETQAVEIRIEGSVKQYRAVPTASLG